MATATQPVKKTGEGRPEPAHLRKHPTQDLTQYCREYARENPEIVALWCFGVGFVLGWRLKPW